MNKKPIQIIISIYFYVNLLICTLIFSSIAVISVSVSILFRKTAETVHILARMWAKSIMWFFKIKFIDKYNFNRNEAYLIITNHQSMMDIFLLLSKLKTQFRFMSKASIFKLPIIGLAMKIAGYIPIERTSPKKSYKAFLIAEKTLNKNVSVLVFPEGTWCKSDGKLLRFKRGSYLLAKKTKANLLILSIVGNNRILAGDTWMIKSRKTNLIIDTVIKYEDYKDLDEQDFNKRISEIITNNIDEFSI